MVLKDERVIFNLRIKKMPGVVYKYNNTNKLKILHILHCPLHFLF